ncbi:MAG: pyridoxal phosphate-dependent aminotransferase [Thermodesulfobacteria bacterium]|nr:pyridoxal phosphate-dependent aminotransferase [Thermodesulfobacteriota bacterium]
MFKFSRRVSGLKPSATLAVDAKAKALVAKGIDVINLAAGEPDFDTPEYIKKACKEALDAGLTKYVATPGLMSLREAICKRIKEDYGFEYTPEEVLVTAGAKHAIFNLMMALIDEGDEVIILTPYWVSYPAIVSIAGGKPVFARTSFESGFEPSVEELEKHITEKTVGIILNSPSNPTGLIYSREFLKSVAEISKKYDLWIMSDDIYDRLRFDFKPPENILSVAPEIKDRVFLINGVSKAYAMTGWRIGWLVGNKDVIKACTKLQSQSTSHATAFAQKAAEVALTSPQDTVYEMCKIFAKRAELISSLLKEVEGFEFIPPQGAFYLFLKVSYYYGKTTKDGKEIKDSVSFAEYLLDEARVAVVPGVAFGEDEFIRISFANSEENLQKAVERIKNAVLKLTS